MKAVFIKNDFIKKTHKITDKVDFVRTTSHISTFKIPNSLIVLEIEAIKDENVAIKWDCQKRWLSVWNKGLTLTEVYKNATVWFYKELACRIGPPNWRKEL